MSLPENQSPAQTEGHRILNSVDELRQILLDARLSRGAAANIIRGGWSALADETPGDDEAQWIEALTEFAKKLERQK